MNIKTNQDRDDAQQILDALRRIQDTPELQAEVKINPDAVMNRLGLSGVARHAVAFALTALVVGPTAAHQLAKPNSFWV